MAEVYIIASVDPDYETYTEVYILNSVEEVNAQLADLTYGNTDDESVQVYHGVLLDGDCIPPSFNGCTPYILLRNPERFINTTVANEAYFNKVTIDPEAVMSRIESFMSAQDLFIPTTSEKLSVSINDIKIFFGYKMTKITQIFAEKRDDEILNRLRSIESAVADVKNNIK